MQRMEPALPTRTEYDFVLWAVPRFRRLHARAPVAQTQDHQPALTTDFWPGLSAYTTKETACV
jgi:hypothetical protein